MINPNYSLHDAVSTGDLDRVNTLLESGFDINRLNNEQKTPLLVAVETGFSEIAEFLLKKGASLKNSDRQSVFRIAIIDDRIEMLRHLFLTGSPNNSKIIQLLCLAIKNHKTQIVEFLLERSPGLLEGYSMSHPNPLLLATISGQAQVVKLLLEKGASVHSVDREGCTPLFHAIASGQAEVVKLLVENGARVDAVDIYGKTPLVYPACRNQFEILEILLEKVASSDWKDSVGVELLCDAASSGQAKLVKLLIERGVPVDGKDNVGITPLSRAASSGRVEVVLILLNHGASIDQKDNEFMGNNGKTPLIRAMVCGEAEVVKLLLEKGARVDEADVEGKTPLIYAALSLYEGPLLTRFNRRPYSPSAILEVVSILLDRGAKIDVQDRCGMTPLSHAAVYNQAELVSILLNRGAKIDVQDRCGMTPLSHAAAIGRIEVLSILLQHGAKVDFQDESGLNNKSLS